MVFAIPGKHPQTGEAANFVARVYTSNPNGAPGPYKNSVPVTVQMEQTLKGSGLEPASGSEVWEVRDAGGGTIELRLQYQRGVAARVQDGSEQLVSVSLLPWYTRQVSLP